jgi:hypothetical protein
MPTSAQSTTSKSPAPAWSPFSWFPNPFFADSGAIGPQAARPAAAGSSIDNLWRGATDFGNPWLKACNQTNAELMGLASRRTQAVMALATQVSQCRAPQDLLTAQAQFWQLALAQQTDTAQRVANAWSSVLPAASMLSRAFVPPPNASATPPLARDRITFKDPKDDAKVERDKSAGTIVTPTAEPTAPPRHDGNRRTAA